MDLSEETTTFTLEDILKTQHFDFHKTYPIDKVFPHPNNPRKHSEYEIELLEIGIVHFGFTNPLLIQKKTNIVIAGHARLKAAIKLGLKGIPVRIWDCSDEEAEAHMIADNKISQHSDWDKEHLIPLLMKWRDKTDKNLTGFSEEEMQLLINSQHDPSDFDDDEMIYEPPVVPITQPGDLWILGKHRLLCGDATNADDVGRLLNGTRPFLMVTDPPYGVGRSQGFSGKSGFGGKGMPISRRKFPDTWDEHRIEEKTLLALLNISETVVIWGGNFYADILPKSTHWIVWDKEQTMPTFGDCELAWTNSKRKSVTKVTIRWNGLIGKEHDRFHPTQKPVALMKWCLENYSQTGETIFDPYIGSGTTIVASEMLAQHCYGLEISPAYCDVIIQRWETLTGLKAEKANGRTTT